MQEGMQECENPVVVKKFGGTSVAHLDRIRHVAQLIMHGVHQGEKVVAVVSAMAGVTDQLAQWALSAKGQSAGNMAYDLILSSGEQVTVGLLCLALQEMGLKARPWMGWQLPIMTDDSYGNAEILSINTLPLLEDLEKGIIPVVAGFQGMTSQNIVTTLGRGGSDTTAVALAAVLQAKVCQIFTDVAGVYSGDPSHIKNAKKFDHVSYTDMQTLSQHGAQVLHIGALKWAARYQVPIHILSTFSPNEKGTWICENTEQSVQGVAQKSVLLWTIMSPDPEDIKCIFKRLNSSSVDFWGWSCDHYRLQFFTDPEVLNIVQGLLPVLSSVAYRTMLTIVGLSLAQFHQNVLPSLDPLEVEHILPAANTISVIVNENQVMQALKFLHNGAC